MREQVSYFAAAVPIYKIYTGSWSVRGGQGQCSIERVRRPWSFHWRWCNLFASFPRLQTHTTRARRCRIIIVTVESIISLPRAETSLNSILHLSQLFTKSRAEQRKERNSGFSIKKPLPASSRVARPGNIKLVLSAAEF